MYILLKHRNIAPLIKFRAYFCRLSAAQGEIVIILLFTDILWQFHVITRFLKRDTSLRVLNTKFLINIKNKCISLFVSSASLVVTLWRWQ